MITAARLREVLNYDPATGVFTWLVALSDKTRVGSIAGCINKAIGYRQIRIDGDIYREHRLAWLYVYGEWPLDQLDHKDTIRHHNWIDNLRPANQQQNSINMRGRGSSASGYKGVSWHVGDQKWRARICVRRKEIWLGSFDTAEEASLAYVRKARELYGEFARAV